MVESKEYEKAYGMLYTGFKENYFPDLESFETYAKKTFSKFCSVEHTNIERSGEKSWSCQKCFIADLHNQCIHKKARKSSSYQWRQCVYFRWRTWILY